MADRIDTSERSTERVRIQHVCLDELDVRMKVVRTHGVRRGQERVEDPDLTARGYQIVYDMRADEPAASRDQNHVGARYATPVDRPSL
jgi:hypothetical protein